jgi:23S rRNA (uracil1939-C5)-methyltransferase
VPTPKKGSTFVTTVRDLASDGRGILSHPDGLTIFVPGVWPGEECRVRFVGLQNRIGLGELVELIRPSANRVEASCPHHGFQSTDCGGCPWQFMDYQTQVQFKQERVEKAFARLNFFEVKPIWPSDSAFNYRNRAQLKTDGTVIGYLAANSNNIAPIQQCPVLTSPNQQTLSQLLQQLPNEQWRPKAKLDKQHWQWTSLNIDDSLNADQVLVNKRLPFQQSHHGQNERMRQWLGTHLLSSQVTGDVLELFCGAGNFTAVIAARVAESANTDVTAVDGDERALAVLREKQLPRVKPWRADLFDQKCIDEIYRLPQTFSTLVLDPPRDGLKFADKWLPKKSALTQIFYISCNLATLCRDLAIFQQQGFTITEVQALDQTPHTPHIEILVALHKSP